MVAKIPYRQYNFRLFGGYDTEPLNPTGRWMIEYTIDRKILYIEHKKKVFGIFTKNIWVSEDHIEWGYENKRFTNNCSL